MGGLSRGCRGPTEPAGHVLGAAAGPDDAAAEPEADAAEPDDAADAEATEPDDAAAEPDAGARAPRRGGVLGVLPGIRFAAGAKTFLDEP